MSDKISYEARIQLIAEAAAKTMPMFRSNNFDWEKDLTPLAKQQHIKAFEAAARIAIREIAEAIIVYAYGSIEVYERIEPNGGDITDYLIEQGFIPKKEVGNDIQ